MFSVCDVVLVIKIDVMPYFDFDLEKYSEYVKVRSPDKVGENMHELGTINYVINTVEDICVKNKLTQVVSVTLEVGEVSGIVPRFLTEYWKWAKAKTTYLTQSELIIEQIDAITYCEDCKQTYPTVKHGRTCPYCSSGQTFLVTGNEYNIKEIAVV